MSYKDRREPVVSSQTSHQISVSDVSSFHYVSFILRFLLIILTFSLNLQSVQLVSRFCTLDIRPVSIYLHT